MYAAVIESHPCFVQISLAGARLQDVEPVLVAQITQELGVGVPTVGSRIIYAHYILQGTEKNYLELIGL